jgi:short-subunit dehydrogenase
MPSALITGATSGIGAALARRSAGDGLGLVLVSRDEHRLAEAAEGYRTRYGVKTEILPADLTTDEGIGAVEDRLRDGVDLLVNNAGFGHRGAYPDVRVGAEVDMLKLHCEAVVRLTYAALPGMLERRRGGVINVASVAAFFTRGTYAASKAWVVAFSQAMAADIEGSGVRVMALCPGFTHTEFHQRAGIDTSTIPGPLWLSADQVAREGMRDFARGLRVSVPSARYKAIVALGRLIPPNLSGRLSNRVGRRFH